MQAGGCGDVVEASGLGSQIVGGVTGFDMVVVGAAVEGEVPGGGGLTTVGVVGDFVGAQDVAAVVDFGATVQFVDVADFFLLQGADGGGLGILRSGLAGARRGGIGSGGAGFFAISLLDALVFWPEISESNWLVTSAKDGS